MRLIATSRVWRALAAFALATLLCRAAAAAEQRTIEIGAGAQASIAYFLAQQLCRLITEAKRPVTACNVHASGGSVSNLAALRNGEFTVAFAQSDWHYHSLRGTGAFADRGPDAKLRSLFSAHAELLLVLARGDASINGVGELKGRRLNVGPAGSPERELFERVMAAHRWAMRDFAAAAELRQPWAAQAVCKGRLEAMIYLGAHPDAALRDASERCELTAIPVAGGEIDRMLAEHVSYVRSSIPAGLYRGVGKDVPTIGTVSTVVATSDLAPAIAYEIVRLVFDNIARLRRSHPALARLDPKRMASDGLAAPLHEGAARYYREKGWLR